MFYQLDIVAALAPGHYFSGPYAAIQPGGVEGNEQTSIIYDARTGETAVDAPANRFLDAIKIDSAASIFTGEWRLSSSPDHTIAQVVDTWGYKNDDGIEVFSWEAFFDSVSFGNVTQPGLEEDFIANDLTVWGRLTGGDDLGDVDLIYIPEHRTPLPAGDR